MDDLPEGKPMSIPTDDYLRGFTHGKAVGTEEGRKQLAEELRQLLGIYET